MVPDLEQPRLRPGGLNDVPAIVALQARCWQAAYRGLVDDAYLDALPLQDWIASWRRHLYGAAGQTYCVVAEEGGRLLGFSSVGRAHEGAVGDMVGELHTMYVDPGHWGSGLARRLLEDAQDRLREWGYTDAVLWVLDGNLRATRFYEAAGWWSDGATGSDHWGATEVPRRRLRRRL